MPKHSTAPYEKPEEYNRFGVKVINGFPPVWGTVCTAFQMVPLSAVFSYGDCIYNPSCNELPEHIIVHEKVHLEQQKHSREEAALWFGKFLRDPEFRVEQEIEAYAAQYKFICKECKDRNMRFKFLHDLATHMSGPLYSNCISHAEAMQRIKDLANVQ